MTRVIVHAGFHKTGTTSLQSYLAANRDAFAPWFSYYGPGDLHGAGAGARLYAQRPFPWRGAVFRHRLRRFLATVPEAGTIVISRENFSGVVPGHRDWAGRPLTGLRTAAVPLIGVVASELRRRFGPDVGIELLYTTREREPWLRSVYGHLLRSIRLTESFEAFCAGLPATIDLADEAREIGRATGLPVHVRALEGHAASRPGPARAVLELAGVPETTWRALPAAPRRNPGLAPALESTFLELNRSAGSKAELKRLKAQAIAAETGRDHPPA